MLAPPGRNVPWLLMTTMALIMAPTRGYALPNTRVVPHQNPSTAEPSLVVARKARKSGLATSRIGVRHGQAFSAWLTPCDGTTVSRAQSWMQTQDGYLRDRMEKDAEPGLSLVGCRDDSTALQNGRLDHPCRVTSREIILGRGLQILIRL